MRYKKGTPNPCRYRMSAGRPFPISSPACYTWAMSTPTHILLIEDDPAIAHSLRDGLTRNGYAVTWEAAGAAGVRSAHDRAPHLIILDIRLPDGSGFDFCRQMRKAGLRQPILMLTAHSDEVDKVLGLEVGGMITSPSPLAHASCWPAFARCCAGPTASCRLQTPTSSTRGTWPMTWTGRKRAAATRCWA